MALSKSPSAPTVPAAGPRPTVPLGLELTAYRAATAMAMPLAGVILRARARRGKEDLGRQGERLGLAAIVRPAGPLVWIHAASVGEANSVLPLIHRLASLRKGLGILLTTGTVSSAQAVEGRLPEGALHQYVPLDSGPLVRRFLEHWRPSLAIFTEQEIWPNLIVETHARGIPLTLVNGRMSTSTFERWSRRPRLGRALFSRFDVILAQNEALAARFTALGGQKVVAGGNLKIDAPPPPVDRAFAEALDAALAGRPRLLAASTHEGEEAVVAEAHRTLGRRLSGLATIIAPRHPPRGAEVVAAVRAAGLTVAQRSKGEMPAPGVDVFVVDTIGELGTLYATSPLAFIGGSMTARGGQNPIEAVHHGCAVLVGPNRWNFEDSYAALLAAGGSLEVSDAATLANETEELLTRPELLAEVRENGRIALERLTGALERALTYLLPLLDQAAERGRAAV